MYITEPNVQHRAIAPNSALNTAGHLQSLGRFVTFWPQYQARHRLAKSMNNDFQKIISKTVMFENWYRSARDNGPNDQITLLKIA